MLVSVPGQSRGRECLSVQLSNDNLSRRITENSTNLHEQPLDETRKKPFAIRVHEATICANDAHLITYVRYGDESNRKEGIANSVDQKYLDNC
jgi:hypothetical protein